MICPALAKEQMELQSQVDSILHEFQFFQSICPEPRQDSIRREWFRQAKVLSHSEIPDSQLVQLTCDFWNANKTKEFFAKDAFSKAFISAIGNAAKQTKRIICPEFISMLVQEFNLQVEANTNALHRSD